MSNTKSANIILIGCGPHSKRVYLPAIKNIEYLNLKLVVDLESQSLSVVSSLNEFPETELLLIEPFDNSLPSDLSNHLTKYIVANNISGVIIATEPLVHKAYAEWAIENGLNILMDKHGEVVEREALFKKVWETNYTGDTRTLDVHISWLRRAIELDPDNPKFLKTIRGIGYRLDV